MKEGIGFAKPTSLAKDGFKIKTLNEGWDG